MVILLRPQLSCAPKKGMPEPFQYVTAVDPAIRIRFPQKRMTMGEMRKRVRTTGEYVTRIQLEAVEREKRVGFLASVGLSSSTSTSTSETTGMPALSDSPSTDTPVSSIEDSSHAQSTADANEEMPSSESSQRRKSGMKIKLSMSGRRKRT